MWHDKIDRIVCLNLAKRIDRLLAFTEMAEKLKLPFERIESIFDSQQGARGLRDTIYSLFLEEIVKETSHLLIFEDDAMCVVDEPYFNQIMGKVVDQLPSNYHMIFLGCQITGRIQEFYSENIFPVIQAYSTHAVLYSLSGMKAVIASNLDYPIDNHLTKTVQPLGKCYAVDPLLFSQVPGISDIGGGNFMDWTPFIVARHEQKINEYKLGMR